MAKPGPLVAVERPLLTYGKLDYEPEYLGRTVAVRVPVWLCRIARVAHPIFALVGMVKPTFGAIIWCFETYLHPCLYFPSSVDGEASKRMTKHRPSARRFAVDSTSPSGARGTEAESALSWVWGRALGRGRLQSEVVGGLTREIGRRPALDLRTLRPWEEDHLAAYHCKEWLGPCAALKPLQGAIYSPSL